MHSPVVSVIVPSHNSAKFLPDTIESVVNQTFTDWELLVMDDGSTDNTLDVAMEYAKKDPRIKVFSMGYNSGGPAGPRNSAMKKAKGRYLAFLDSDDLWLADKLREQVEYLEANPGYFMVYTKCIIQRAGKILAVLPKSGRSGAIFRDLMVHSNFIDCLTVMIRNRFENNKFFFDEDKKLVAVEDYDMWVQISRSESVAFLAKPSGIYRIHSSGISAGAFRNFRKCGFVIRKFAGDLPLVLRLFVYFNFFTRLAFVGIIENLCTLKRFVFK